MTTSVRSGLANGSLMDVRGVSINRSHRPDGVGPAAPHPYRSSFAAAGSNDDSEGLERGLLVLVDLEQFIELGDLEDFVDLLGDVAHHQLPAGPLNLAVHGDELTQRRAGEELDVAE